MKEYLDELNQKLEDLKSFDTLLIASSGLFGISHGITVSLTNKIAESWNLEQRKGVAEWFAEGTLYTYRKVSTPFGKRKNSRKKDTTSYFMAERGMLRCQLGHQTTENYVPDFWTRAGRNLVQSALQKEGEFSYYNFSYVNHMQGLGKTFEDRGEKKD
jgi:hypothetical protein